jgi:hypothetical protein
MALCVGLSGATTPRVGLQRERSVRTAGAAVFGLRDCERWWRNASSMAAVHRDARPDGDAGEEIGEPSLWIDVIRLGGVDNAVHRGGALTAAIGAGEEPRLPAEGPAAKAAFRSAVREAHASVVKAARKGGPALEDIVPWLGRHRFHTGAWVAPSPPGFEIGDHAARSVPGGQPGAVPRLAH